MAFTDLDEHLSDVFRHEVPELALYEDRRNQRTMHIVREPRKRPRTARRAAVLAAAQKRWVHRNSELRRWSAYRKNGRTHCAFPECRNMLVPPWVIRPGKFATTCGKECSQALATLRRALERFAVLASVLGSHHVTTSVGPLGRNGQGVERQPAVAPPQRAA